MTTYKIPLDGWPDDVREKIEEARRAVEQRPLQFIIDDETRPLWECAKRAAAEVAAWPAWKHTEQPRADADQSSAFWRSVAELAAMRKDIPEERRAMSAVRQMADAASAVRQMTEADCCRGDLRLFRCVAVEREAEYEDEMAEIGGEG
jgi:hypothetical protein